MKHLLKITFALLAIVLGTAASAQTTGAYLKYDLDGKTISYKAADLGMYNNYNPGTETTKTSNRFVLYYPAYKKGPYYLSFTIYVPAHTAPVVGKIPFVEEQFLRLNDPFPSAFLELTKSVGKESEFYASKTSSKGYFEITKVSGGWVEGKFELDMPKQFESDGNEVLHITNGTFRFKIEKETRSE
ncbi:MAG: hypothetical protein BGO31_12450 [Bacteroidetes bacterium 43-16]|nr:MAG: hypothetical protein BGO31_12450 [Bacteroidetes bacterium 43-16]